MQLDLRADSTECDYEFGRPSSVSRHTKVLVAGVAMATAGVLAVNPLMATPALPEIQVSHSAVGLSAFDNPLLVWQQAFENTFSTLFTTIPAQPGPPAVPERKSLVDAISLASTSLTAALMNPQVQQQFTDVFTNLSDPQRLSGAFENLPGYVDRLSTAGADFAAQMQEALEALPGVVQLSAGFLAEGRFLEAFAEINYWFLTAGLSDFRGSLLDALRVPGDFADDLGLEPLARILGTSWMITTAPGNPQIDGPGLLARGVIGNFGRALLAPTVTAIFQTVEILDATGAAVQAGDFETAASELINAPARITNAFLNGYVPAFVGDPDGPFPPGPGQSFPGFFSPTGTVDFFFAQVPSQIARALTFPRPTPPESQNASAPELLGAKQVNDFSIGTNFVSLPFGGVTDGKETASTPTELTVAKDLSTAPAPEPTETTGDSVTTTPADLESTAATSAVTDKNRFKEVRQQAAEARKERAEARKERADRLRSAIRKGLRISEPSKDTGSGQGVGEGSDQGSGDSGSNTSDGDSSS